LQAIQRLVDEPREPVLDVIEQDRIAVGEKAFLVVRALLDRHAEDVVVLAELFLHRVVEGERALPARPARPRRNPPLRRLVLRPLLGRLGLGRGLARRRRVARLRDEVACGSSLARRRFRDDVPGWRGLARLADDEDSRGRSGGNRRRRRRVTMLSRKAGVFSVSNALGSWAACRISLAFVRHWTSAAKLGPSIWVTVRARSRTAMTRARASARAAFFSSAAWAWATVSSTGSSALMLSISDIAGTLIESDRAASSTRWRTSTKSVRTLAISSTSVSGGRVPEAWSC